MKDKQIYKNGGKTMQNAMDKLINKIIEMNNPTVMGLDSGYDKLPNCIKEKYNKSIEGACQGILEFNKNLIDATYDIIPSVKVNIAFYEMFGAQGIEVLKKTCEYAKQKNMIVILDAKRGDIGSTAECYSKAYIGITKIGEKEEKIFDVDFVTVNPYLGIDGIKPFLEDCKKYGKGIFIIDKTSNPSSGELQDIKLESGKTIYEEVAILIEKWGEELRGEYGYSSISSVVGATYPEQLQNLRKLAPHTFFLIPGYGAQRRKSK